MCVILLLCVEHLCDPMLLLMLFLLLAMLLCQYPCVQQVSKKCEVAVLGLIKLQNRFSEARSADNAGNNRHPETITLSAHSMTAMESLLESIRESIDNISSHLN